MKFRGLLTATAAALLCCFTLGCPPAEDGAVPEEINVTDGMEDNTTAEGDMAEEPAEDVVEEVPAGE